MFILISGLLACLLAPALSQTGSGGYSQVQQSGGGYSQVQQSGGGFYPSPMRGAPYPAAAPAAPSNAPEAQSGPTAPASGPSGGGFPGPFFPPTAGAFLGINPICTKVAIAITRLHSLIEPIKALLVGAVVFFAVKNFVIPYFIYYARAVEEDDDLERSLGKRANLEPATLNILKAVSKGVCLERIACQLGKKAKEYPMTKEVVRAIDSTSASERLLDIFRSAATDDSAACEVYRCDKKRAYRKKTKATSS